MSCPFTSAFRTSSSSSLPVQGGEDAKEEQLKKYYIDETNTEETTLFGQKVDNTQSLKAGRRGPTLMEDFAFREKMMHFGKREKKRGLKLSNLHESHLMCQ
jgi:hypothetical protein